MLTPAKNRWNSIHITIILGFIFIAYMIYSLTVAIYRNYQIQLVIENFKEENKRLEKENQEKLANYQYYISEKYIDKMAKLHLGLINPGEEVIIIPKTIDVAEIIKQDEKEKKEAKLSQLSQFQKWYRFIFIENPWKK
jgi:cell division protein FtsB